MHRDYIANMIANPFFLAYSKASEISASAFFLPRAHFGHSPKSSFHYSLGLILKIPLFHDIAHVQSWRDSLAAKCSRIPFESQQPFSSVSSVGSSRQHL